MKVDLLAQPRLKPQVLSQVTNSFDQQIMTDKKFGDADQFSPFLTQDAGKHAMNMGNGHHPQLVRKNSITVKTKKET